MAGQVFLLPIYVFCFTASLVAASRSYGEPVDHYGSSGPIEAAIKSRQLIRTIPVGSSRSGGARTPTIDINSGTNVITLRFNTVSSKINALQKHTGSGGSVKKSDFTDEPDLLVQNVQKPVVQKVNEIISPFRKISQEIRPVQEQIETIIAKGMEGGGGSGGGGSRGGHGYGGGRGKMVPESRPYY